MVYHLPSSNGLGRSSVRVVPVGGESWTALLSRSSSGTRLARSCRSLACFMASPPGTHDLRLRIPAPWDKPTMRHHHSVVSIGKGFWTFLFLFLLSCGAAAAVPRTLPVEVDRPAGLMLSPMLCPVRCQVEALHVPGRKGMALDRARAKETDHVERTPLPALFKGRRNFKTAGGCPKAGRGASPGKWNIRRENGAGPVSCQQGALWLGPKPALGLVAHDQKMRIWPGGRYVHPYGEIAGSTIHGCPATHRIPALKLSAMEPRSSLDGHFPLLKALNLGNGNLQHFPFPEALNLGTGKPASREGSEIAPLSLLPLRTDPIREPAWAGFYHLPHFGALELGMLLLFVFGKTGHLLFRGWASFRGPIIAIGVTWLGIVWQMVWLVASGLPALAVMGALWAGYLRIARMSSRILGPWADSSLAYALDGAALVWWVYYLGRWTVHYLQRHEAARRLYGTLEYTRPESAPAAPFRTPGEDFMRLITAGWQVGVVTLPLSAVMVVLPGLFFWITLLVLSYLAWGELAHPELVGWYRRNTTTLNHSNSVGILCSLYLMPSVDDPYAQWSTFARLFGSSPKRRWGMAASLCLPLGLVPAWGQLGCWTVSVPVWTSGALLLTSPTFLWIMLVFGAPSVVWRRWSLGTCLLAPVACLGLPLLSVLLHGLAMLDPGVIKLLVILVVMALLPTSCADPTGSTSGASTFTKAVTNATAPSTPASANSWLEWTGLTPGRMASYLLDRVILTTSALFQGLVSTMGAVLAPE